MRPILDALAAPATRAPRRTLAALAIVTVLLGIGAGQLQVSTDFDAFAPADGVAATLDDIDARFGAGASFQVIVDAGPGGDVLSPAGLQAGQDLVDALRDDRDVARWLAPDGVDRPAVLTYATPFSQAGDALGVPLEELDESTLDTVAATILEDDSVGPQVASLLSQDLETEPPAARAGLGVVQLSGGLENGEVDQASRDVRAALRDVEVEGLRISLFSEEVIEEAVESSLERDVPLLMSLSLLLVVVTLALLYRTVSDVVVGFVGLVVSIVWMAGIAAYLGPGGLGLVGPFNQVAIAVPVLLVGLGVDYSVHLTTRYREQQRRGDPPTKAAVVALRTVGVALVLATAATIGGFLSNLATPLRPIADFGVFASVGILSAFVVLGLLVPSVRVMLDRREGAASRPVADGGAGAGRGARLVALGTAAATRAPRLVLGVAGGLVLAASIAAAGLGTEFQERDFLPEGSAALRTVDRLTGLFDGGAGEQTYVLVEGDPNDPQLLAAAARYERELAELDAVRTVGDRPEVTSPFAIAHRLGEVGVRVRDELADDLAAWQDPDAAVADLPLPERLDPELVADQADGQDVELPDELLEELAARLPEGRAPESALATSAPPEDVRDSIREQQRAELLASRPDGLTDEALDELAGLPRDQLTLSRLLGAGFPISALSESDREALTTLQALEAAGWDRDEATLDPADVAERVAIASREARSEHASVRDDEAILLVVSTQARQAAATELAALLEQRAAPIVEAGGEVTVVSRPMVEAEVVSALSDAQLLAIAISVAVAGLLLVLASWLSDRSVALGLIGIVPAVVALIWVLGTMRLLGMSFNALTATVASIAVGIGVPYGIHLTNRYRASLQELGDVTDAVGDTLRHTGAALTGSAITTGLAFGVLLLSSSTPMRQFGGVSAMMIGYALLACLALQPALLVLWSRRRQRLERAA